MPAPNTGAVSTNTPTGVVEFVFAKMETQQAANIAANDHVKFDTVFASRGSTISLDVATAYSNANGAASLGRFTLKAGRTYRLRASVPYILGSGATGALNLAWYDVTGTPAALNGGPLQLLVATTATHDIGGGVAEAIVTPGADMLVELRIVSVAALTRIGTTSTQVPTAFVESF